MFLIIEALAFIPLVLLNIDFCSKFWSNLPLLFLTFQRNYLQPVKFAILNFTTVGMVRSLLLKLLLSFHLMEEVVFLT